jgi:hypothetical protein
MSRGTAEIASRPTRGISGAINNLGGHDFVVSTYPCSGCRQTFAFYVDWLAEHHYLPTGGLTRSGTRE